MAITNHERIGKALGLLLATFDLHARLQALLAVYRYTHFLPTCQPSRLSITSPCR